jgi:hypothetical protein
MLLSACHVAAGLPHCSGLLLRRKPANTASLPLHAGCLYCAGLPLRCQTASMPPACLNATGLSLCHRCYCSLLIIIVHCLYLQSFSFSLQIVGLFFTSKFILLFLSSSVQLKYMIFDPLNQLVLIRTVFQKFVPWVLVYLCALKNNTGLVCISIV